jgi:hypothetical protein
VASISAEYGILRAAVKLVKTSLIALNVMVFFSLSVFVVFGGFWWSAGGFTPF